MKFKAQHHFIIIFPNLSCHDIFRHKPVKARSIEFDAQLTSNLIKKNDVIYGSNNNKLQILIELQTVEIETFFLGNLA